MQNLYRRRHICYGSDKDARDYAIYELWRNTLCLCMWNAQGPFVEIRLLWSHRTFGQISDHLREFLIIGGNEMTRIPQEGEIASLSLLVL